MDVSGRGEGVYRDLWVLSLFVLLGCMFVGCGLVTRLVIVIQLEYGFHGFIWM